MRAGRPTTGCDYLSLPPRMIMLIRIDPRTGCWLWQGGLSGGGRGAGYGRTWYEGKHWSTHILIHYLVRRRRVPLKFQHDHECCCRNCCRPGPGHVRPRSPSNNQKLIHVRAKRLKRKTGKDGSVQLAQAPRYERLPAGAEGSDPGGSRAGPARPGVGGDLHP